MRKALSANARQKFSCAISDSMPREWSDFKKLSRSSRARRLISLDYSRQSFAESNQYLHIAGGIFEIINIRALPKLFQHQLLAIGGGFAC